MQQKELASLLDISTAMVSRLVKRGMPTDTLERAERWRKRHLEPGRVKGWRAGTVRKKPPQPDRPAIPALCVTVPTTVPPQGVVQGDTHPGDLSQDRIKAAALAGPTSLAIVELWSNATRHAQASGAAAAAEMVIELRALLRRLPFGGEPRMALGVWLALTEYSMHKDAELRRAIDLDTFLTPNEFAVRLNDNCPGAGGWWLEDTACDWEGYAVNGWPAGWDVEDDD